MALLEKWQSIEEVESEVDLSKPWTLIKDKEVNTSWSRVLDLEKIGFEEGFQATEVWLPQGSKRIQKAGYEEIYIPAVKVTPDPSEKLIQIKSLPDWV